MTAVEVLEKERIDCEKEVVYLRMEGDFADKKDEATFYYSYDKKTWKRIGEPCKMVFDYTNSLWEASLLFLIMLLKIWEDMWI